MIIGISEKKHKQEEYMSLNGGYVFFINKGMDEIRPKDLEILIHKKNNTQSKTNEMLKFIQVYVPTKYNELMKQNDGTLEITSMKEQMKKRKLGTL